jgi:spore coat polysaccharide biosynthesis predicted glycosyltransferase SpsG
MPKKKIALIVEPCELKGPYVLTRAAVVAQLLQEESVFIFLKTTDMRLTEPFTERGLDVILFERYEELRKKMRELECHLILHDGKDTTVDQVELLRPFCQTIVHFDDMGIGAELIDCNVLALFEETPELLAHNTLAGSYAFAVDDKLIETAQAIEQSARPFNETTPHIVVCYEDGDANNLTYRTLRHLTQLQIPLNISVAIDEDYLHSVDDLNMMVLSRRGTKLVKGRDALLSVLPEADVVICNANFTPYKIAACGIPCITAAQTERELSYGLPREMNGFIHIGLGRKMKQSIIQNAVMEILLHEMRRERMVKKQRALDILGNNDILQALLLDFAYARHNIAHI